MTRCNYVASRLRAHLDGELAPKERQPVQLHLERCASCRHEFDRLRQTLQLARAIPHEDTPPHFTTNLQVRLAGLRAARQPAPWWRGWGRGALGRGTLRLRWGAVAAGLAVALLGITLATHQKPGVAEIARQAESSWQRIQSYSCRLVTTGVIRGERRQYVQETWFVKPGAYRLQTNQDYRLVTVLDQLALKHLIPGGDWQGRGPLLIVRPRPETQAALPFPFDVTWPAGANVTIDSLIQQLRGKQDAELLGVESVLDRDCYVVRFEAVPPGGWLSEQVTMWIARDSLLPLRIRRYRDPQNETLTEAVNLQVNESLVPSNLFEMEAEPGALVIHGDVDPHVFALKPRERTALFDRDPLGQGRAQVALKARDVSFPVFAPEYLPAGYRLVRARRSRDRWLDAHWIDDRDPLAARVIRLVQKREAAEPAEPRDGRTVAMATALGPVPVIVREGTQPYPHCWVTWRRNGTLLTLSTAELSLAETLRIASSLQEVPAAPLPPPAGFAGPQPPAPGTTESSLPAPETLIVPQIPEPVAAPSLAEPPMMPETAEEMNGGTAGR